MTEKRFTVHSEWRNLIADIKDTTGEIETLGEFVDLLNELHSRNKRLEEKIQRERKLYVEQHLRWSKEAETKIKELSDENEELKQRLKEIE